MLRCYANGHFAGCCVAVVRPRHTKSKRYAALKKEKAPVKGHFSGASEPLKMGPDLHSSHSIPLALNPKGNFSGFIYVWL
jgi:hypothetical protein